MRKVVESFSRCTEWAVQSNTDRTLGVSFWYQTPEPFCPISIRLDMQLDLSIETYRDGERMPLEETKFRDLEEAVLTWSVLPYPVIRSANGLRPGHTC